jgi:hypothetical protein
MYANKINLISTTLTMNKHKYFLALSLASIGAIGAFASVSAASLPAGTPTEIRDQAHTAIKQAITNGDYQAYLLAVKNTRMGTTTITQTQFQAMTQAEKLRASGDIVGAKKVLSDAGVKPPMLGNKDKRGDHENKNEMANLTDAQKATLKQARDLMKAGKQVEAKALLDSAGLKMSNYKAHASENSQIKKYTGLLKNGVQTMMSTIANQ